MLLKNILETILTFHIHSHPGAVSTMICPYSIILVRGREIEEHTKYFIIVVGSGIKPK